MAIGAVDKVLRRRRVGLPLEANSTTSASSWSDWQDLHFTVPESYSGSGLVSIKIEIYGFRNYVQIDNLKIKNLAYGGRSSLNSPQRSLG